ncbi:neuropeptide S receptor-like [Dreissena polymorpha]|uniref:neuropeptide S receptor-like n=1 Tax=Dreissena polymorpha TaxID=45954 RepID=UPI002263E709|nr:neuropeptide S receptor-like [Dreissena polymorpha]
MIQTSPIPTARLPDVRTACTDIELDKTYRLLILYATVCLCIFGSMLVLLWMLLNKRVSTNYKINRHSRVSIFILNLIVADVLVILLAVTPQIVWEYSDRQWTAGDCLCRVLKFLQTFSMTASNYMLVVIAIDRHQAIRAPLKESFSIWKMVGLGWSIAALVSLPVAGIFHTNADPDGGVRCENIFRYRPLWHRQIWICWVTFSVFLLPVLILLISYIRIVQEISKKAFQSNSLKYKPRKGEFCLQSTPSNSLPQAKSKTLKMTCVIILSFIICTTPYFIIENLLSFGMHCVISKKVYAILAGMAACNSATNPYVFLAFNVNIGWFKRLKNCYSHDRQTGRQCNDYHNGSSNVHSHHGARHSKTIAFLRQDTNDSNHGADTELWTKQWAVSSAITCNKTKSISM